MARSSTYSFDYVVASAGGADQSSAAYSMVAIVQTKGSEGKQSASQHYAVTTVLDARGSGTSSIADWSLY
jgi:hypothetical protein